MYIEYHTIFFKTLLSCFASCKDKSSCGFLTIVSLFQTVELLKVQLNLLLKHGTAECPLVVILDSLDQLDTSHNGRYLMWLPASLPPHCKIIVSSLPEEKYETFPALKKLFPDEDRYIQVPELDQRDAHSIVASWAQKWNRTLTQTQMELLLTTFRKCPTPLFLKLSAVQTVRAC
ncbi:hypothetical protein DPMN_158643 [Dreissena polymorpha]|uniref:NACHT domain-containing protein n=1 Tax=Dreissena polymorpha TaxID=45954 RepID=A0A9D4BQX2_DREPO|nr:hypothetical protein DPMN_078988 [Dreissena polymorpha]KAH3780821.1 hypothetical protein DPMN_158643 [Dreissena polymorpha]